MRRKALWIKLAILGVIVMNLLASSSGVASQKRRAITVRGEGLILNYSEEVYWGEEQFNQEYEKYSENKAKYLKDFIENFSHMFLESGLKANDWSISFKSQYSLKTKETTYSVLVQCKIDGAGSGTRESPYFRTEWLLMPILGGEIDLYKFKYLTNKMLAYEGEVNHIPIKITFEFSKPISHCHYHIWYR